MKNNHTPFNGQPVSNLDALRRIDSCTISNAIERANVRPRNEGLIHGAVMCRFPQLPPIVGHAVTGRIQTYMAPVTGKCYYDHIEWWRYVETIPKPRIVVLQDFDPRPGYGAIFGEVHARICQALGCVGFITNGAARDLDGIESTGLQVFSGAISVSHSYAHVVDFGAPIHIGGLEIQPGDILHGDRNGVLCVPPELVEQLPGLAAEIHHDEQELFALTRSHDFNVAKLAEQLQRHAEKQRCK
jgi:regulator of RNase E activity RraA